jgi:hypothetical protein
MARPRQHPKIAKKCGSNTLKYLQGVKEINTKKRPKRRPTMEER